MASLKQNKGQKRADHPVGRKPLMLKLSKVEFSNHYKNSFPGEVSAGGESEKPK